MEFVEIYQIMLEIYKNIMYSEDHLVYLPILHYTLGIVINYNIVMKNILQ